jgi:hypothetical protein
LSQRLSKIRLSCSGGTYDDNISGMWDIVAGSQFQDELAVKLSVILITNAFHTGGTVLELG